MNLVDRLLDSLKLVEVKAQDESAERKTSISWSKRVSFNPFPQPCVGEESTPAPSKETDECEPPEENECEEEGSRGFIARRLVCMAKGAQHGLREGALTGVFFGGGVGLYKYIDSTYFNPKGGGGSGASRKRGSQDTQSRGSNAGSNDSTVNDNIIFVCACNSAIFMGVLCTIVCSLKNTLYCS